MTRDINIVGEIPNAGIVLNSNSLDIRLLYQVYCHGTNDLFTMGAHIGKVLSTEGWGVCVSFQNINFLISEFALAMLEVSFLLSLLLPCQMITCDNIIVSRSIFNAFRRFCFTRCPAL